MRKILVVDDDPAICDVVQTLLESEGYNVQTTLDGTTAIHLDNDLPDLLLLDVRLSGQDGCQIARILKQKPQTKHIPIIMISANQDLADAAVQSGVDDYLEKPFDLNLLIQKIEHQLSN